MGKVIFVERKWNGRTEVYKLDIQELMVMLGDIYLFTSKHDILEAIQSALDSANTNERLRREASFIKKMYLAGANFKEGIKEVDEQGRKRILDLKELYNQVKLFIEFDPTYKMKVQIQKEESQNFTLLAKVPQNQKWVRQCIEKNWMKIKNQINDYLSLCEIKTDVIRDSLRKIYRNTEMKNLRLAIAEAKNTKARDEAYFIEQLLVLPSSAIRPPLSLGELYRQATYEVEVANQFYSHYYSQKTTPLSLGLSGIQLFNMIQQDIQKSITNPQLTPNNPNSVDSKQDIRKEKEEKREIYEKYYSNLFELTM